MSSKLPVMTTAAGVPVADNENSLTPGPRGPVLMDYQLMERMAHFNRARRRRADTQQRIHHRGNGQ